MIVKIKLTTILEYLFIIALVLNCRSVYTSLSVLPWFRGSMFILLITSVSGYILLKRKVNTRKLTSIIIFAFLILLYLFVYLYVTKIGADDVIQLLIALAFIVVYYSLYCDEDFLNSLLDKYVNIIVLITFVSLIFWIFASNLELISPSGEFFSTWGNRNVRNYFYLYFETQSETSLMRLFGLSGYRNTAIFNEAPMFSFHLTIALLIQFFLRHDYDKRKLVTVILGIITSFSTTGYIVMTAVVLIKFIIRRGKNKITQLLKWLCIPLFGYVIVNIIVVLLADKLSDKSGLVRLDDIQAWLGLWKDNVIFGAGYGTQEYIRYLSDWRFGTGVSNSIVMILGYGGLWLLALYFLPCVMGIIRSFREKNLDAIVFIVVFLFIFAVTVVPFQYLTFFLFVIMKDGFRGVNLQRINE